MGMAFRRATEILQRLRSVRHQIVLECYRVRFMSCPGLLESFHKLPEFLNGFLIKKGG
jgi:hypothetical protein